jgi:hypothetical protein
VKIPEETVQKFLTEKIELISTGTICGHNKIFIGGNKLEGRILVIKII